MLAILPAPHWESPCVRVKQTLKLIAMCKAKRHYRKRSRMLSGVISRHQICYGSSRCVTNRRSREFDSVQTPARTSRLNVESTVIRKTTIEDAISETTLRRLRHHCEMVQTQVEQHEIYSAAMKNQAQVEDAVEVKVVEPKNNSWKWIAGLGFAALGAVGICWTLKK